LAEIESSTFHSSGGALGNCAIRVLKRFGTAMAIEIQVKKFFREYALLGLIELSIAYHVLGVYTTTYFISQNAEKFKYEI
jgi:hypothetical protein